MGDSDGPNAESDVEVAVEKGVARGGVSRIQHCGHDSCDETYSVVVKGRTYNETVGFSQKMGRFRK